MSDFVFILIIFLFVLAEIGVSIFYIRRETKKLKEGKSEEIPLGMIKQDIENLRQRFENGQSQIATELGK